MKSKFYILAIVALLVTIGLSSCDKNRIFDSYVTVPEAGWSKDSLAMFNVNITYATSSYNLLLHLRNTPEYPNSNLWLFIDVTGPSGKTERDKVECILANQEGKWLGSGWGSIYETQIPYKMNVKFPEAGTYKIRIAHGMRTNDLPGIRDIGLRVEMVK